MADSSTPNNFVAIERPVSPMSRLIGAAGSIDIADGKSEKRHERQFICVPIACRAALRGDYASAKHLI